jgi:hypothetical protein
MYKKPAIAHTISKIAYQDSTGSLHTETLSSCLFKASCLLNGLSSGVFPKVVGPLPVILCIIASAMSKPVRIPLLFVLLEYIKPLLCLSYITIGVSLKLAFRSLLEG